MADPKAAKPASPWLSQLTAAIAIVAACVGHVIAPGLRGAASQRVVDNWEGIGQFTTYAFLVFLSFLFFRVAWDLVFTDKPAIGLRLAVVSSAFSVGCIVMCILIISALRRPFVPTPSTALVPLTLLASLAALVSGAGIVRMPHTRATGFVLFAFGSAALVRVLAWWLAGVAGARAAPMTYEWARAIATVGVIFEGVGQLVAVVWLTTRTRVSGQILAGISVLAALVVTWGMEQGGHAGAATWQVVLHTALAGVRGTPPPAGLGPVPTFLAATSLFLAAVAVIRPGPAPAITSALSLCLIARGAFDAPLNAFAASVAAACLLAISADEKTMWRALAGRSDTKSEAGASSAEAGDAKPTEAEIAAAEAEKKKNELAHADTVLAFSAVDAVKDDAAK